MDSKLFVRKQSGGMFTVIDKSVTTGNIYWVDDGGTDAVGNGQNPDAPFATLDYAIGKCTASQGDVIYVMEGHAENLTTATSVNCDVAGIKIIGLGEGCLKPTFSTTAAAGSITVGAANVTIENIRVKSNYTGGTTTGFTIAATGDGCTLRNIDMRETTNAKEMLIFISVATTVNDLCIDSCSLVGIAGGGDTNAILFAGTSSDCVIKDCYIFGDFADDVIDHMVGASVNFVALRNRIINSDAGGAIDSIAIKSDGTGYCADNYGFSAKNDASIFTGDAVVWDQNSANNTIASSGIRPHPAAVAAVP